MPDVHVVHSGATSAEAQVLDHRHSDSYVCMHSGGFFAITASCPRSLPLSVSRCRVVPASGTMSDLQARSVKDVPIDKFIEAYAAHLKANDKVRSCALGDLFGGTLKSARGRPLWSTMTRYLKRIDRPQLLSCVCTHTCVQCMPCAVHALLRGRSNR